MTAAVCPSCGCNLQAFEPIQAGPLTIDGANGPIRWKGHRTSFTATERCILFALASYPDHTLSRSALINASGISEDSRDPGNVLNVFITRIRRRFEAVDPSFNAIKNDWGRGYRWTA